MTNSRSLSWIDRSRWQGLLARVTDAPATPGLLQRPIPAPRTTPAATAPPIARSVAGTSPPLSPAPSIAVQSPASSAAPAARSRTTTAPPVTATATAPPAAAARPTTAPLPVFPPRTPAPTAAGLAAAPPLPPPPVAAAPLPPPLAAPPLPPPLAPMAAPEPARPPGYRPFASSSRSLEERLQALVAWIEDCVPCRAAFIADDAGLPVVEHLGAEPGHIAAASSILLMLASVRTLMRDSGGWLSLKLGAQVLNVVEVATRWGRFGIGVVTDEALPREFLTALSAAVERAFHGETPAGEPT